MRGGRADGALAWAHAQMRHQEVLGLAHALRQAWEVRDSDEELRLHTWANSAAQELDDRKEQRWAIHHLALIRDRIGQPAEAQIGYERALTLARQLGDPAAERLEVHGLAVLDGQTGRLAEARAGYERALGAGAAAG